MTLHVLWLGALFVHFATSAFISEVFLGQEPPFPVELGGRIRFRISPRSGNAYDDSGGFSIFLDSKVIGSWSPECRSYVDNLDSLVSCEVAEGPFLHFFFTPKRENFGQHILMIFYPNSGASFAQSGQVLLNTTVQLTKQPTFLNITITLEREPDYVRLAPGELNLSPPTFLDGSMAKVECKTDGALPPQAISFRIVCNKPPRAAVEQERQAKAQLGYPYEISYSFYHFRSPPTDEELAESMAIGYAQGILDEARIARSQDNLTLSASLPINSKAHGCSLYCRLMSKEEQIQLTVYYQTTVAYILPPPTDGLMRVGSSMTCHADGFPEPTITLSLRQPMRQYHRRPIIDLKDYQVTTSPVPPVEQFVDTSDIAAAARIGLRPDEYTIRGPRFTLAYNATPGVELLLVCTAGNALPNALDFLGYNKTIAMTRFTVAGDHKSVAISYSSIGIVIGICMAILLCAIIIILLMVYLRRKQKYASNAIQTRNSVANPGGANGTKVGGVSGHGKQGPMSGSGDYAPGSKTNRRYPEIRSSVVADTESPHRGLLSRSPPPPQNPSTTTDGVEYAELTFSSTSEDRGTSNGGKRGVQVAAASSTLGRRGSAGRPRRDPLPGPPSASMQQLPRSHTQGSEDGEGNYTEIIGVLQPKAYTSQLVLKQQQEATQAILGMHANAPSVFV
ncbi:hypothetical transcript [Echinococcus multilocularis]|uniref:Hypothetical transcript n=1 Tax=Echinococcus multilocularis TaxID=6211 RepID=A0A068XZH1_ECHMU|nr:hypothetical transcript [Echinococcus multilocularis]